MKKQKRNPKEWVRKRKCASCKFEFTVTLNNLIVDTNHEPGDLFTDYYFHCRCPKCSSEMSVYRVPAFVGNCLIDAYNNRS